MKKAIIIIYTVITFVLIVLILFPIIENSDFVKSKFKDYIIERNDHNTRLCCDSEGVYSNTFKDGYYTNITINLYTTKTDSSYYVVFWGDRNSILWNIIKDYNFSVDIPYNRYKGKDVTKDLKILEICKYSEINAY